jgi:hypothetical protein
LTEAAFPLLGAAFVLVAVLPASALLCKLLLLLLERGKAGPLHGFHLRYLLLTGSSALPLAWLVSAALHQAESGQTVLACLFEHASELCAEPRLFAAVLGLAVLLCAVPALRRRVRAEPAGARSPRARLLQHRIERLLAAHGALGCLRRRVHVSEAPGVALEVRGVLRPRVLVGAQYAEPLADDVLASALAHEAEHVRAWDPLRYLLLELALEINPIGSWLLRPHARRWLSAREAHCDRDAVLRGSQPLALAQAIVRAARPAAFAVALGAADTELLRLRVGLLLAFAERRPARCACQRRSAALSAAALLFGLALSLPHGAGTGALDALHSHSERALLYALP